MDLEPLLRRIGLDRMPPADADGLRELHRAFVGAVPYEALAAQLGEGAPLDAGALGARLVAGRGGYCFELNTVLHTLLTEAGFVVERRLGTVNERELPNHMALVLEADGQRFLADAGLGEGPLDPVALADGVVTPGPLSWHVERIDGGWRVTQHEHGTIDAFVFADEPSGLDVFQPHHLRLSSVPESPFVQTLVVQQPYDDRIVTLRSRTLSIDGPGVRERMVLADAAAFAATLDAEFGIPPEALGPGRLSRLWARAVAQHDAWSRE